MSIRYVGGNMVHDNAQVLVCTTNAGGVMGKGVAKSFREHIPKLFYRYRHHCQTHNPHDMVPYVFERGDEKFVYCLHTKLKWWLPSNLDYVVNGLTQFVAWCRENQIQSIAIPPLGCGNGGLTFEGSINPEDDVKPIMERFLKELDADVRIYAL